MMPSSDVAPAEDLLRFIDASPSPYHAVAEARRRLQESGFRELDEREEWSLGSGDRVFLVRGGGTLVAVSCGRKPPSESGFVLIGAHTDSPGFRVKPKPEMAAHGQQQLSVEVYGSPLLHTWLDRDLSVAGRVSLLDGSTHLVRLARPLCRISSLAIHLSPTLATEGLRLNPQYLQPALALGEEQKGKLLDLVAADLAATASGAVASDVAAFDLALFDVQKPSLGGAANEFLFAPRLDNLASCHAALVALLASLEDAETTRGIVLYDHEEVGSQSAAGASSLFLRSALERLAGSLPGAGRDAGPRAFSRSLLVSADMAHAVHPSHSDKHDPQHSPRLGAGPVVKVNASQSYATDAPGAAVFERACRTAGFAAQRFVSRNDMRCGSTIGPVSAARLGVRTVDAGNPMLSMHSCREVAASADVPKMIAALSSVLSLPALPRPDS